MHKQLRAFLEANGLPATATEEQAWEHHRKLVSEGIVYNGPEKEEREPATAEKTRESPAPAAPAVTEEQAREMALAAARAERVRVEEIRGLCAHFDVPEDRARALIDGNKNLDEARAAVLEYLKASNQPFGAAATAPAVGLEADEKFRAAAIDGVLMQVGVRKPQPAPGAAEFRALSPLGLARNCLERAGVNTAMMSASQIARRALIPHSTSDFPLLLTGIGKETLLAGYTEAPQSWRPLAAVGTATDFRDMYAYSFGGGFDLKTVREDGEYETADAVESGEKYRITRAGRVFPYTFEMLVNDKWGVLSSVTRRFGAAAQRMETRMFFEALTSTATMGDGNALFSAGHGNLLTAAPLSETSLEEAIQALWSTRGLGGEYLDLQPAFLLVSTKDKFRADVLIGSTGNVNDNKSAAVINPLAGMVQVITDPRVAAGAWYLFAAPSQAPVFEASWLDGEESPVIDEDVDFITDGVRIKCRHCFGVGRVAWRGVLYNPGA